MQAYHQLVLASESPRRKFLLQEAGYCFETFLVKVSENLEKNLSLDEQIKAIAQKKAEEAFRLYKPLKSRDYLILSADTVVVHQDEVLGKPLNAEQACQFLKRLSGSYHLVKTALCLVEGQARRPDQSQSGKLDQNRGQKSEATAIDFVRGRTFIEIETTKVYFKELSDKEISDYVASGEPLDKAGAYGIQGLAGKFVEKIEGPYDNVVGLPRDLLAKILSTNHLEINRSIENVRSLLAGTQAKILAVSKLQSVEKIRELYLQGQRLFAENYVQEGLKKMADLSDLKDLQWHFIGRLQKNKAKQVVGKFDLIHGVDSLELAEVLNKTAASQGIKQKILLQINLADEESKGGFSKSELSKLLPQLISYENLAIVGWMAMPPFPNNPEENRPHFQALKQIQNHFLNQLPQAKELSMGTSSDYLVAATEGATIVRLGTVLFGERPEKGLQ